MLADFFTFVLDCFMMVVKLFRNTVIDGISFETMIVAAWMLQIVLTSVVVTFRPSFRPPKPPKTSGTNSRKNEEG